jgi:hypothetical protein
LGDSTAAEFCGVFEELLLLLLLSTAAVLLKRQMEKNYTMHAMLCYATVC